MFAVDKKIKTFWDYIGITIGVCLTAASLIFFLIPNKIAAGGVSGLAIVIYHTLGIKPGYVILGVDIPLLLISAKQLGIRFVVRTLYGSVLLSVLINYFSVFVESPTGDSFLAALYGGVLAGAGMGLVFRFGGTTGGTDLAAQLIKNYLRTSVGKALLFIDAIVIALAGIVFNLELALYALIALFTTTKVIDVILEGRGYAKAAFIISEDSKKIAVAVLNILDRGATMIEAQGVYTGENRDMLLVVMGRSEVAVLKKIVKDIDPDAFIIITDINEAIGEGFKKINTEI